MAELITANIGSYPRIGEEKDQQRHRRALAHLQNREISTHAFHDVEQSVIQEIVREQILAGVDEVTDGHVSWHDPISHFCRNLAGIRRTGLRRYFDTNTYYRVPVFMGKPRRLSPSVLNDFIHLQNISNKPPRVVLTGPYTLARHTGAQSRAFKKLSSRVAFFTDLLKTEIASLVTQGAALIQIDEPAIAHYPEDISLFRKTMETLFEHIRPARFILALYFSPLASLYPHLRSLPVDVLNLDFTYDGKRLIEELHQNPPEMALGFGLVNGRNTRLEPIDPILRILKTWSEISSNRTVYLTPSCGLEFLPRKQAYEKLKLLTKIQQEALPFFQKEQTDAP